MGKFGINKKAQQEDNSAGVGRQREAGVRTDHIVGGTDKDMDWGCAVEVHDAGMASPSVRSGLVF